MFKKIMVIGLVLISSSDIFASELEKTLSISDNTQSPPVTPSKGIEGKIFAAFPPAEVTQMIADLCSSEYAAIDKVLRAAQPGKASAWLRTFYKQKHEKKGPFLTKFVELYKNYGVEARAELLSYFEKWITYLHPESELLADIEKGLQEGEVLLAMIENHKNPVPKKVSQNAPSDSYYKTCTDVATKASDAVKNVATVVYKKATEVIPNWGIYLETENKPSEQEVQNEGNRTLNGNQVLINDETENNSIIHEAQKSEDPIHDQQGKVTEQKDQDVPILEKNAKDREISEQEVEAARVRAELLETEAKAAEDHVKVLTDELERLKAELENEMKKDNEHSEKQEN